MRFFPLCAMLLLAALPAGAVRVKDLGYVQGPHEAELVGYGLVVGLPGTGDRFDPSTQHSIANMLSRFGIRVATKELRSRNVASVLVTATQPSFPELGRKIAVWVASIGDASNLDGGLLLRTPLQNTDGEVVALAQGAIVGAGRRSTTGRVPAGGKLLVGRRDDFVREGALRLILNKADFQTAERIRRAVADRFGPGLALAEDAATIRVKVPSEFKEAPVAFVAQLGALEVVPDEPARVVVDERSGAVVIGGQTRLLPAAVAIGGLEIEIAPGKRGPGLKGVSGDTLQDLVAGLNALGAEPDQLVEVLKALHAAGVLVADLEVL